MQYITYKNCTQFDIFSTEKKTSIAIAIDGNYNFENKEVEDHLEWP